MAKAIIGSILVVCTYLFWFGYVYVLQNDLFFYHPWIDIPFHIAGGFLLALLFGLILLIRQERVLNRITYYWIVWFAMIIGVIWEYYEYIFKLQDTRGNLLIDTIADIGNDFIGALLALGLFIVIVRYTTRKYHHEV